MADMAKAMQGMAAAVGGGDGKPVEPVAIQTRCKATLPEIVRLGDGRARAASA